MSKLWILVFVAACGAKTVTPTNEPAPTPTDNGSATATPASAEPTGPICGTRGVPECSANMFCNFQPGANCGETDMPGHCSEKPQMCAEIYKPVCGCDGKTYSNSCTAAAAGVGVRADDACK